MLPGGWSPAPIPRDHLPPSSPGSGAAEDTVAAPGSQEGCIRAVCSRWGPSPSPSSASRCLRDPRLVVSTQRPRGPTSSPAQVAWAWVPPALLPSGGKAEAPSPLHPPYQLAPSPSAQRPSPTPPAPPRSPSVKTLRKDKELQSTPLKASEGSRLLSRSRTWRTWMRASRTVYGSVGRQRGKALPGQQPPQRRVGLSTSSGSIDFQF